MQLGAVWLRQLIGTFIAAVAGLTVLIQCLNGKGIAELTGTVVALFAGLTIVSTEWPLTISLGLLVLVVVGKDMMVLLRSQSPSKIDAP